MSGAVGAAAALLGLALGVGGLLLAEGLRSVRRGVTPARWIPRARARGAARPRRLAELLARAGWARISASGFVAASILAAVLAGALCLAFVAVPAAALVAALVAGSAPFAVAAGRARRRGRTARAAWPDAVDLLVASVRAGMPLPEAVAALADSGPEGARRAFARFGQDLRRTGSFARCADALKEELADPVADRVVQTLKLAREVGGTELVGVLRELAASLREEQATRAELEARQGWVVGAARLGVAAPWLVLALLASRPEGAAAYATPGGTAVVLVAAGVSVVAYRLMLAVGRLPQERRWFR